MKRFLLLFALLVSTTSVYSSPDDRGEPGRVVGCEDPEVVAAGRLVPFICGHPIWKRTPISILEFSIRADARRLDAHGRPPVLMILAWDDRDASGYNEWEHLLRIRGLRPEEARVLLDYYLTRTGLVIPSTPPQR